MNNPLLTKPTLPYNLPDWKAIKPEHMVPAAKEAMRVQRDAWEAIATDPEPPTIANTVDAVERAGALMDQVSLPMYTLFSSIGGEELDAIQAELSPLFSEHYNAFSLDKRLYERYAALDLSEADDETKYLVEEKLKAFRRGGIELDDAGQARLRELDAALSAAEIEFRRRATKAMEDNAVVATADELTGVDPDQLATFATEDGTYRIDLNNFTNQAIQTELTNPATRQKFLDSSLARGLGAHESSDTRQLVHDIAKLRAERAALLGYPHHAAAVADRGMAGDAQAVYDLLTSVAHTAVSAVERDRVRLEALAEQDPLNEGFAASDWTYYEEKLRSELGVDDAALRPYLELGSVVENGIFYAANKLYGLRFEPRPDLDGYVDSMKTWEVFDEDGNGIALFQADYFHRSGKNGGAWMNSAVVGSTLLDQKPVILNNCNFAEPKPGEPVLLSWDNVITVFHEFGHALHGMLGTTRYPSTSGTSVPRDFVELPSQLNEMWAFHPEVLANYAKHFRTGEPMPAELTEALSASQTFGQAFATTEFVAAALVDQAWHRLRADEIPTDIDAFEEQSLREMGAFHEFVPPRYRSAYFSHTFGGGYDAGYYSYMWAEVLVADLEQWFRGQGAEETADVAKIAENGGLNRTAGRIYATELLCRGSSRSPMDSFVAVRGRRPRAEALLERRGLAD